MQASERPPTGVTLIVVTLTDTVIEWRLWVQAGGIMLGILVLSRLALLAYGVALLRHQKER